MSLQVGDPAPDFSLIDQQGNLIQLSQFRGERVVLYFYPRDNTPGCTQEACSFRDAYAAYQARRIRVLGISADTLKSHQKFAQKLDLPFPLLVDENAAVATAYGVYGRKKFMGKEFDGITRATFVIGSDGLVEQVIRKLKVETHAADLLASLP